VMGGSFFVQFSLSRSSERICIILTLKIRNKFLASMWSGKDGFYERK